MNLIFMRHGEATNNVEKKISDKEIYWSILTDIGIEEVIVSIKELPDKIDKIYVSSFPRTIQTAHLVYEKYPNGDFIIDNRIREIFYGKYSGKHNNEELDQVRKKQIAGDYFIRFGDYGENKWEIESRLCQFLNDIYLNNDLNSTVLIISHGSIISYMKRILNIYSSHILTGRIDKFNDVDFSPLFQHIKYLENINKEV